tara:strand:+ start:545 stop:994 length:450 start_codon:yes stop_codon:yes gene_type:complete
MKKTMKFHSLLAAAMLLTPIGVLADEYQRGYTTQRSCFKEIYREEYVPGTRSSQGYVKSFSDTVEVPCSSSIGHSVRSYNYHQRRHYRRSNNQVLVSRNHRSPSCSAGNATTGGLIGGGLAAALSKKDAYGWSVPLGAVLGMGIANVDC